MRSRKKILIKRGSYYTPYWPWAIELFLKRRFSATWLCEDWKGIFKVFFSKLPIQIIRTLTDKHDPIFHISRVVRNG